MEGIFYFASGRCADKSVWGRELTGQCKQCELCSPAAAVAVEMGNQQAAPAPPSHPAPPPAPQESPGSGQVMEVERGAEVGRLSDSPPAVFSVPAARLWEAGAGPAVPLGERWSDGGRARAATLDTTVGQSSPASVQAVFRWAARWAGISSATWCRLSSQPKAETVYLAGTMTGWKTVRMFQPAGETAWVHITDTRRELCSSVELPLHCCPGRAPTTTSSWWTAPG